MVQVFSHSQPGGHADNEDAFAVSVHPHDPECYLCVVADGQGGRSGGAVAARQACAACINLALTYPPEMLLVAGAWTKILQTADEAVAADNEAGFTTLVAFCVKDALIKGASCGDSAALLIYADKRAEFLTDCQQKNPPVGSRSAIFVEFAAKLAPPWTVLAMSDGVWKYVGWENICTIPSPTSGAEIVATLLTRARLLRTGALQDDFTLVVLQNAAKSDHSS